MLLTAILVVIVLALIYHFVTEKKQILEWKETRAQQIPVKKIPEEIIKESQELQLKADKKQVGKTKKKTKSKKSKKAIKTLPKGTDISKEKTETDKKIEMAESSPETIPAVAETRNIIPQIVPNVATEKKAAERIGKKESRKEKKKSKKKSKTKKSKKGEMEVTVKQHMNKQTHQTEKAVMESPTTTEITAAVSDETVIVQPIRVEKKRDEFIKEVQKIEKEDSTKLKKKTKKRSKSRKSKRTVQDTVANEAACSQMPKADITSPKLTLASEVTARDVDQPNIVPPIAEETVEKPVIKDEPKVEKKDFKKSKKRSKKRTKSKKSKKIVEDTVAKEAASSQMPKADITSPKFTLASEATAINLDQPNIVPPISVEEVEKPVIKDERKGEKKDSKKSKKRSKKRSKSRKSKKIVEDKIAK
ncbi:hypothetical protein T09_13923 [Trichinella sp. T9]|nr:hypothetical protein T09_13923 [Trichinella sp. T9]